jgi:hypothetical protein
MIACRSLVDTMLVTGKYFMLITCTGARPKPGAPIDMLEGVRARYCALEPLRLRICSGQQGTELETLSSVRLYVLMMIPQQARHSARAVLMHAKRATGSRLEYRKFVAKALIF